MRRLIGQVSFVMVFALALSGGITVAVLFYMIDLLVPPTFSASLATVQNVSAEAWLVFDVPSGQVIYSYRADKQLPIASITKLTAAKVFSERADLWATTTVSWADVNEDGRAGKLYYGETYMYYTMLFPLLLESSNDAAHVFTRGHSSLIDDMNAYAAGLGLQNTNFADASGLSDNNVSTVSDIMVMARNTYLSNRHLMDITALPEYYSLEKGWLNTNPFVFDQDYLGGKHGFTNAANRTAVSIFNETLQNGVKRPIGYVLLGSGNLERDMSLLRDHVQNNVSLE